MKWSLSLIDTIGFDDPKNDTDAVVIADLVTKLQNKVDYVNTFIIAVNGQDPRLHGALLGMIRIFEGMFGTGFWKQTVIVFTRLPMDKKSVKKRNKASEVSDEKLANDYIKTVEDEFPDGKGLDYLFMDSTSGYIVLLKSILIKTSLNHTLTHLYSFDSLTHWKKEACIYHRLQRLV